jgi:sigma-B regulation protein RsbU (phosphoserine phosphatase)
MVLELTLVVSEPSAAAEQLCTLLVEDGMPARHVSPARVLAGWYPKEGAPDLVLVNAALDIDMVGQVVQQLMRLGGRPPTVVSFAETTIPDLEPHVRAGLDYIVPPFVPGMIGSRLLACHVRQALSRTAEGIQTNAGLLKYERELQIGQEIQAGFLPEVLPNREGWQLTARFQPAREVAGDFYDAFELLEGDRIGLVVADVCDKGVGAAMFMALVRSLLRHAAINLDSGGRRRGTGADRILLQRAVVATNDYLTTNHLRQGYFATVFFGVLDPASGSLIYANCGHNPPVLQRATGGRHLLGPTGPALGLMPDSVFGLGRTRLDPGDLLFAYTDGVPEAKDATGRFFGRELLLDLIAGHSAGADDLLDLIERTLGIHVGAAEQSDDITMIALHREPVDRGRVMPAHRR